jgi:hypothetical protein
MDVATSYKAVGGVESVALYPANAVSSVLFSSAGCEVEFSHAAIEIELLDDSSHYEEVAECNDGVACVSHQLSIVADRGKAHEWLTIDFLERASCEGLVADVLLCDGRRLLVGYSLRFGSEQPLRLDSLTSSSGSRLCDTPAATLRLVSYDTEFSAEIL